jgi:uncharacterized protein YjbJ (UPF0337 family)
MKPSTQDKIEGNAKIVSGSIKQETGKVFRDPKLEVAGNVERSDGRVQKKVGEIEKVLNV